MTTKTQTVDIVTIQSASGMVLCDGVSKTSVGGKVTAGAGTDLSAWKEMTEAEADDLIKENAPKEDELL